MWGGHAHFGETPANLFFFLGGWGVLSNREKAATPTPQHLNPLDLLYRLDALLPPESLLVADGGDFVGTAAYIVRPRRPLSWLDPGEDPPPPGPGHVVTAGDMRVTPAVVLAGAFGTLGVGGGFALGAKLCRPEAEVWRGGDTHRHVVAHRDSGATCLGSCHLSLPLPGLGPVR